MLPPEAMESSLAQEVVGVGYAVKRTMTYGRRCAVTLMVVAIAAIALMPMFSQSVSAATVPKGVRGYVEDSVGNRLDGALVVVNIRAQADYDTIRATGSDTTGSDGYYSVTFAMGEWDIGDTIQVIATYDSHQHSNETTADAGAIQDVWVVFPYEIPQFGSLWGTMIAVGAIGAVGAIFVVYNKRRKTTEESDT